MISDTDHFHNEHLSSSFERLYRNGGYHVPEFGRHEYWARVLHQVRIVNDLGSNLRVLEIGCGKGEVTRFLRPDWEVYGLDMSRTALAQARQFASWVGVGSAFSIPFSDRYFDVVLMFETLYYSGMANAPKTLKAFAEAKRVLRPGGTFVLGNGLANDPSFWHNEAKVNLFLKIPPRLFGFIRRAVGKPPKDPSSYSRYVLTAGEIKYLLKSAGFSVESFYPYFLYVPLLCRSPRWLPLMFRLGKVYPMLARYGLFFTCRPRI